MKKNYCAPASSLITLDQLSRPLSEKLKTAIKENDLSLEDLLFYIRLHTSPDGDILHREALGDTLACLFPDDFSIERELGSLWAALVYDGFIRKDLFGLQGLVNLLELNGDHCLLGKHFGSCIDIGRANVFYERVIPISPKEEEAIFRILKEELPPMQAEYAIFAYRHPNYSYDIEYDEAESSLLHAARENISSECGVILDKLRDIVDESLFL